MLNASKLLSGFLRRSVAGEGGNTNWRINPDNFKHPDDCRLLPPGTVNLSPGWFQQGHTVSHEHPSAQCI